MSDTNKEMMARLDEFLLEVQKPSRYIGGEHGAVIKGGARCRSTF